MVDPTQRFSNRVENYARFRPYYPQAVPELLKAKCGLISASVIADVGSGTGILSGMFLERGNRVFGVEPNEEMRKAGERLLERYPNFTSVAGTAKIRRGSPAAWISSSRARLSTGSTPRASAASSLAS